MSPLFTSGDQNAGTSASASVLPMSIQDRFPLRLADLISSLSKGLSGEGINSLVLCLLYGPALTTVCVPWEDHNLECMDLCQQSDVSAFQHTVVSTTGH